MDTVRATGHYTKVVRLQEKNPNWTAISTKDMYTTTFIESKDGS